VPHDKAPAAPLGGPMAAVAALERRLILGVIAATLLLLIATTGVISNAALGGFEREVLPEMTREATAIGATVAAQIERAVTLGVPVDRLVGIEPFFEAALASRPTLDSIRLETPTAEHRVQRPGDQRQVQDVAVPVMGPAGPIGTLHLGVNPSRLERSAADSKWDILIVLLVALLATVEGLVFLTDRYVSTPLRLVERLASRVAAGDWTARAQPIGLDAAGRFLSAMNGVVRRMNERWRHTGWLASEVARQAPGAGPAAQAVLARLGGARFASGALSTEPPPRSAVIARTPLFLYVFAEQLSTSFIPIFAKTMVHPGGLVPEALAVGLPITAFAGMIAIASPFGAAMVGRLGARAVLALGCIPAIIGYLMVAQADTVEAFTLWRAVTAIGYALITISCQSYLVAASDGGPRGRSMAVFVYAAMTGAVCGTAIGAVLADRLGYRGVFVASAALTLGAGILALRTMDAAAGRRRAALDASHAGELRLAVRNPAFLALVLFAAVPAKLVLTGFVFYISPLFLLSLGDTQPEIGRQMMLYAGAMLLTIRAGAWAADRMGAASSGIALAGLATGGGLLLALVAPAAAAVPLAIVVTGLSQGLASAPMLAVVPELCPGLASRLGLATLYGYLRFGERIGSIAGPILAAGLVASLGFAPAIAVFGALSVAATLAYLAVSLWTRRS
jgi:predicted MFS family arabinose efflux permease/HAMP domain-containing protein